MKAGIRQPHNAIATAIALATAVLVLLLQINIGTGFPHNLDASWGEVLGWGIAHGAQWGKDLEFTYGPLGFVTPALPFNPAIYWPTLLLQIGFAAITALLVAVNLRKLTLASALAFVLATIVFGWSWSTSSCQIIVYPLAAMILESISRRNDGRRITPHAQVAGVAAFAALQPLIKFSTFPLWLVWLPFGMLVLHKSRDRLLVLTFILASVLAPAVAWLGCGQNLGTLGSWLSWSWQLAAYYPSAMQVDPLLPVTDWVAFLETVFWLVCIALFMWKARTSLRRCAVYMMFAATVVLTYKAGNTRAADGGHLMLMWSIYAWCAPLLIGLWYQGASQSYRQSLGAFVLAALPIISAWISQVYPPYTVDQLYGGHYSFSAIQQQLNNLIHPVKAYDVRIEQWKRDRAEIALPVIRRAVGRGSVDIMFNDQGALLANNLNYRPRPVFQSYSAYSDKLARLNANFFLSTRAPDWVMLNWQPIGQNYPTTEDARALIRVLQSYRPVLSEGGYLLFQHQKIIREGIPATPSTVSVPLQFESAAPVPSPGDAWFAKVDVKLTFYGKLYSLLFRPPQLKLEVGLNDGSNREYVLTRDIARSGFMLSPALDTNAAYLAWLQGDRSRYVTSIKLLQRKAFNHRAFKVDGPLLLYPLSLPHHYAPTLALYADWYPGFNHMPASVPGSSRTYTVDGKPVMFLPAPGLLTFDLPPGTYTVSTQYGLMPNALTSRGCLAAHADGFGIEIGIQDGRRPILSAYIDPFKDPAHKYDKNISGVISVQAGQAATVAITTGPPGSNGSCDWAWIRDLKFIPASTGRPPQRRRRSQ